MSKYREKYNLDTIWIDDMNHINIRGWIFCKEDYELQLVLDGINRIPFKPEKEKREDVARFLQIEDIWCGFEGKVEVIDMAFTELEIQIKYQGEWLLLERKLKKEIKVENRLIVHYIDSVLLGKECVTILGWAFSKAGEKVQLKVKGSKDYQIDTIKRPDVRSKYSTILNDEEIGFKITVNHPRSNVVISYEAGSKVDSSTVDIRRLKRQRTLERLNKVKGLLTACSMRNIYKAFIYLKKNGCSALINKLKLVTSKAPNYNKWLESHMPGEDELKEQRNESFNYQPLISILVPTYNTPQTFLKEMIESVRGQSYSNWELCIADGASQSSGLIHLLNKYMQKDKRIKVTFLEENRGIAGNTNACIELATGEYIALFDHDDLLAPNALYEVVKALNKDSTIDFLYTDEDKVDELGKNFFDPHFKPDWSPDTLLSYNYICHFTVFKASLLKTVGNFNGAFDGSQDYDLFLRLTEVAYNIHHIPKILYHWRVHKSSTAAGVGAKEYTIEAARGALQAALKRRKIKGIIEPGLIKGTHRVSYELEENPKVSIMIPNKDHIEDLDKCLASIAHSTYQNYEVIIIENNSTDKATFEYYEQLVDNNHIKVVRWEQEFNYSKINNFGATYAEGEYFILLNNDIEILTPNWIEEMLMHAQREEIGIVGAKLYYADDTIQHAGVIIGVGGVAGHSHKYYPREDNGYMSRLKIIQNLSAVTAACLMVKRSVFEKVDGLDEGFKVAFNDVDFCLRVLESGYLVIFTPYVEAYHYESKSRGAEDTVEKQQRFEGEVKRFCDRWGAYRKDSYYNPNLTLAREDFTINL